MEFTGPVESAYLFLILILLPWGGLALHLWALWDTIRHHFAGAQKVLWVLMNLCVPIIGPLLYVVIGRRQRQERVQAGSQASATPGIAGSDPSPACWLKPIILSLFLVIVDEQGVLSLLIGLFFLGIYLPKSLGERYRNCRRERLTSCAIYLSAVVVVFGLRMYNMSLAEGLAATVIAAVEVYRAKTGAYPERLEQLVPGCLPAIPSKAKLTLMDRGFTYISTPGGHTLSYVVFPPFGRRVYDFEGGKWRDVD